MKRKFLTVLFAIVAALCLCFGLAACGETPKDPTGTTQTQMGGGNNQDDDLWTEERLYDEAKALGFDGSFDDLVALFKGADGKDGRNGVGIASAKIDENGHLQITLTDGNVLDAGAVSGASAQIEGTEGLAYHMRRSPTGEETLEVVSIGIAYDLDIVIPATYRGIPVTAIAGGPLPSGGAFAGCSDLTSISIPDSVISIGDHAFYGCSGLTNIKIPDGVTKIGNATFMNCTGLTSIKIPDGVTEIGMCAFQGCTELTGIQIPDDVTKIGAAAFEGCAGLTSIKIPDGVTEIGAETFGDCIGLQSVTIGSGVTSMGDGAFNGCSGLTGVYITDLAAWCKIDFGVEEITANPLYCAHHLYLDGVEVKDLTIPAEIKEIKNYAFLNCSGLESVTIGSGVTSIGDKAFGGCSGLTGTLKIPDGVTSIGENAFSFCSGLESVTIGNDVASIGHNAFWECAMLTSVTFVNPNGWSADGTALLSDALQNATTAVEYLRETYCDFTWTRQ